MRALELIQHFDHRLFYWCVKPRHQKILSRSARIVSRTGDGYLQLIIPLLFFVANPTVGRQFMTMVFVALVLERCVYLILKNTCKRKRPPVKLDDFTSIINASDEFSFPSGHSSAAFLLATIVVLFYGTGFSWMFLWATSVGASRVILGVHFPTDILAGAAIGTGFAVLISSQALI